MRSWDQVQVALMNASICVRGMRIFRRALQGVKRRRAMSLLTLFVQQLSSAAVWSMSQSSGSGNGTFSLFSFIVLLSFCGA
jgi:hypothetical protein